ncbi:ABC transporter permease [Microlunatus endophyticus]|uniref:ABC transporter permease n=1 Tax=Microlunatus endophyticus TaxID=1716077 RepID=A0A917W7W1_9ACTN|nr:ABC transporter permease [Microlunatus endophyticus]GGL81136.1 ABC transporter permease [Microlunatus endophyticus]
MTTTPATTPSLTAPAATPGLSFGQAVRLIAEREILTRLRSRAFQVSTGIMLLAALAGVIAAGTLGGRTSTTSVAVVGDVAAVQQASGLAVRHVGSVAEATALVRAGTVDAAVVADRSSPAGIRIIADESSPDALVAALSVKPQVTLLDPPTIPPGLRYAAAFGFALIFLMSSATFGGTIAQSVVEEKQTRIVEILISAISTRTLLTGKILGNSLLAFAQVVVTGAFAVIGLSVTGESATLSLLGAPIAWFVIFFVIGFVLLASMFAAAASLVSRQEDIQATVTPVTMLVMIPYFLVIFFHDNSLVLTIMSYVPFSAAVGMPLRIFLSEAAWWEPLLSLLILLAGTVGVIVAAAKIYGNALLRTGAKISVREALRSSGVD